MIKKNGYLVDSRSFPNGAAKWMSGVALFFFACSLACVEKLWAVDDAARQKAFETRIVPLMQKHCFDCHSGNQASGGLSFESYTSAKSITKGRKVFEKVVQQLQSGAMPPADGEPLPPSDRALLVEWTMEAINAIDCVKDPNPGKVTIRRLNRNEYRNTVRDLTGIDYVPAKDFPGDDVGYGFDNIGDVLTLPPLLMEKYLKAAEEISSKAILAAPPGKKFRVESAGAQLKFNGAGKPNGSSISFHSAGEVEWSEQVPWGGTFMLQMRASGNQAGNEPVKVGVLVDGKQVRVVDVPNETKDPKDYSVPLRLRAGKRTILLKFLNDFYRKGENGAPNEDRNLMIHHVALEGQQEGEFILDADLPPSHLKILFVRPSKSVPIEQATEKVIGRLASRAYRRPVFEQERAKLVSLARQVQEDGNSFEASIQIAMEAILISPQFLYRIERPHAPAGGEKFGELDDFEIATRLSYFLWSTMPDDELLRLAIEGKLREQSVLREQVLRMLQDKRANQMVENFAGQWLQLRKLNDFKPDKKQFPQYNDQLRDLMRRETLTFFAGVMRNDESVLNLLAADYTYLNQDLAKFYGIAGVQGEQFRKVSLVGTPRGGLLTHASILAVTSNPTRTSPVKRGKFILDNLLGTPPPPAPAGVPELKEKGELVGTLRERMEQHRVDPACAACHKSMDPLGFALENFDAIGRYRTKDGGETIDPSGELPDGSKVSGAAELRGVLLRNQKDKFVRSLTEKMLTYALGRGLEYYDKCTVDKIVSSMEKEDYRFSTLVMQIVQSDPFRKLGEKEL